MHMEDIKGWLREAKNNKNPDRIRWDLLVIIFQV